MEKRATHTCYRCGKDFNADELVEKLGRWNGKCPYCNAVTLYYYEGGDSK